MPPLRLCRAGYRPRPSRGRRGGGRRPFRALVAETSYPPLARRFLAWAHVLEETGALHAGAEATLHAAWVADDMNRPTSPPNGGWTRWRSGAAAHRWTPSRRCG
ncbi:hypothetical protein ACFQU7_16305 [Pseudoroseomonas wenyumeiae]